MVPAGDNIGLGRVDVVDGVARVAESRLYAELFSLQAAAYLTEPEPS